MLVIDLLARLRFLDNVEEDLKTIVVRAWRVLDGDDSGYILKKAVTS